MRCLWHATSGPLMFMTSCYPSCIDSYWNVTPPLYQAFLGNRGSLRQFPSSFWRMRRRAGRSAPLFGHCVAPAFVCLLWRGPFVPGRGPVRCARFRVAGVPLASLCLCRASLASTLLSLINYCVGHTCGRYLHGKPSCYST